MADADSRAEQVTYLNDETTELIENIDALLLSWMTSCGAKPALPPPLITAHDLDRMGYFQNFPHQANVVSMLRTDKGPFAVSELHGERLRPADLVVPSAACYGIYVQYADKVLSEPGLRTSRVACARTEDSYQRFRRLRAYYVREYVYLGTPHGAKSFVDDVTAWLRLLIAEIGLSATIEPAADSFFQPDSSKVLMQRLSNVKQEIVYRGDLAVSSINYHRNFFGQSYGIRLANGQHVHTACFGAGLERWTAMMLDHYSDSPQRAREALESLRAKLIPT
jgi:seryl-tRNA synthetase